MKIDVVPEKLGSPINYSVLLLIGAIVVIFHIVVNISKDSDALVYGFSMIIPATVSVFAFITARRYAGTLVYSRAYKMLGIAFLLMFSAEFTYFVYEQILKLEPYPSIADVFFFCILSHGDSLFNNQYTILCSADHKNRNNYYCWNSVGYYIYLSVLVII